MKQLALIATIFLPLTFVTGFFGQNFPWMVGHVGGLPWFLALGIGTQLAALALLVVSRLVLGGARGHRLHSKEWNA